MDDEYDSFYYDTDLDLSFTSTTTDRTLNSSTSARSSLARSSLTLSFNDRLSLSSSTYHNHHINRHRPHRRHDPNWSAIRAATNLSSDGRLHLRHLKLIRHLGTGDLGRVFLCRIRDFPSIPSGHAYPHGHSDGHGHGHGHGHFALKVVDKDTLSPKKLAHAQTEAKILSMLDHPFLPTLYAHIEVSHYTCLLIDYCSGGDLHSLLRKQPSNRLPVQAVKFYAAEILVALEYLHSLGIVYRDLKPENILLKEDGHVMLSDFDLCFTADVIPRIEKYGDEDRTARIKSSSRRRRIRGDQTVKNDDECFVAEPTGAYSRSCVGTHEYLAPELVNGNGHGNGVDWWAFGVLLYELMYGTTPFKGANKEGTLRNIASSRDVRFGHVEEREEEGMAEIRDLIEKLLVKDPRRRLGSLRGAADIKKHPFFNGVKWALIRSYRPPEVRGGLVKKSKSHLSGLHKRRKWWWRGLSYFLRHKASTSGSTKHSSSHVNNKSNNKIRALP